MLWPDKVETALGYMEFSRLHLPYIKLLLWITVVFKFIRVLSVPRVLSEAALVWKLFYCCINSKKDSLDILCSTNVMAYYSLTLDSSGELKN